MAVADITQFQKLINDIKSILVILPVKPSIDDVAAGLSLALSFEKDEKTITVSSPEPMLVEFNRLVGVDRVRENLGDKNLVVSFSAYPPENIERVTYDIDNGQFALVVVPKAGFQAPGKDQINTSYAGMGADMIVVINANFPQDLGKFAHNKEILEKQNLVLLGNTPLNGWPKAIELIDPSSSSVSEVVYDIITQSALPMDEDIATNLFAGLAGGTGNFTAPTVSAQSFAKAAELLKNGARRGEKVQTVHTLVQPRRLPDDMKPKIGQAYRDSAVLG